MYTIDKQKASVILKSQNFEPYQINLLLKNYPPLPDAFGKAVEQWLIDKTVPDLEVDGITLKDVMTNRHSHFLVAIRDLSHLLDPTLSADEQAQWHRILSTPLYYE